MGARKPHWRFTPHQGHVRARIVWGEAVYFGATLYPPKQWPTARNLTATDDGWIAPLTKAEAVSFGLLADGMGPEAAIRRCRSFARFRCGRKARYGSAPSGTAA